MSDQDRIRQREHWQAIAEQLGLSPESESNFETPTETAKQVGAEMTGPDERAEVAEPERMAEASSPSRDAGEQQQAGHRQREALIAFTPQPEAAAAESAVPASEVETDVAPRKRGRRRRSADASTATGVEEVEAGSGERERRDDSGRQRRQGGSGRRRSGKGRRQHADKPSDSDTSVAGEAELVAEAENPADDLADDAYTWNVPSWNELIASLYRPER